MKNNNEVVDKYIIVKDLNFSDYMKDESGNILLYDTYEQACIECGMYEFEDVLILKIVKNYIEK
jgi:hypothetical protein